MAEWTEMQSESHGPACRVRGIAQRAGAKLQKARRRITRSSIGDMWYELWYDLIN